MNDNDNDMKRKRKHFLLLGFWNANFHAIDIDIEIIGKGITARPKTMKEFRLIFGTVFSEFFVNQIRVDQYISSWIENKFISPMLTDEETAILRAELFYGNFPLPDDDVTKKIIEKIAGVGNTAVLSSEEWDYLFYKMKAESVTSKEKYTSGFQRKPEALERLALLRKEKKLSSLLSKYKIAQFEWEPHKPLILMEEKKAKALEKKLKKKEEEEEKATNQQREALSLWYKGRREKPPEEGLKLLQDLIAKEIEKSSASQKVSTHVSMYKKNNETQKRWNDFISLRKEIEEAYIDLSSSFPLRKKRKRGTKNQIDNLHDQKRIYKVSSRERKEIVNSKARSVYIGGIGIAK